ncbi:DNA processing protein [Sulfitobacter mediterraneus KCTC 32188]|nr:DNA processing protein [Sulfitobacter mediterraneus KCTC 32188]
MRSRRVGISTYKRLLAEHGTAQNALAALPQVARAAGVSGYEICPEDVVRAELRAGRAAGAQLLIHGTLPYPAALAELDDAPPFLWMIGQPDVLARPMISLVGARNASSLGTRMAKALAKDLAQAGYVVVSGLARGIDAAAHHAALETGTIAVQAGGVDVMYPAENTELAGLITKTGLRLSEQPMGLQPMARHFPARNRIISGLSRATVVVEAAGKSGSLITARDALDQGREVLAVPGHPFDARASGCNMLIRDGAVLVRSAADVLEALAPSLAAAPELALPAPDQQAARTGTALPPKTGKAKRGLRETASLHLQILSRLGPSPMAEDQLIRDLQAPAGRVGPALVDLEMDGQITRRPGGLVTKAV